MAAISSRSESLSPVYRWNIAARFVLAFLGGFVWISTSGALLAVLSNRLGWMPLAQGVYVMTLLGFVTWCGVSMWVFYERRLPVVAGWLLGSSLVFYLLFLLVS